MPSDFPSLGVLPVAALSEWLKAVLGDRPESYYNTNTSNTLHASNHNSSDNSENTHTVIVGTVIRVIMAEIAGYFFLRVCWD